MCLRGLQRMDEASSSSVDADAIVIPPGKQLRFRCKFEGCLKNRSFSMISIMDHVAAHFARQKGSNRVFNYYCRKCRVHFFLKGMCLGCKCNARGGGEQFIPFKSGITSEDMNREASFFMFLHKWIVPVFDDIPAVRSQKSTGTDEVGGFKQHGPVRVPQGFSAVLRMPSCYPDGTPRSPAFDDDEEEIGPAYYSAIRNRSCSRTPMTDTEEEINSLGPSAESENPVSTLWSSSLPEPRMFSNIFLQQKDPASSAESVGKAEQQPSRGSMPAQEATTTLTAESDESLPFPPPPQPPSIPPVPLHDDDGTPNIIIIPLPPPPPPVPAISPDAQPSSQPGAESHISNQDKNAKRRLTGTARMFSKKSRQDDLLEENPSPPRSPRRGISRSPGPHAPTSPFWKQPSTKTSAHEPDLESHIACDSRTNHTCSPSRETPRTPAYGSVTPYSAEPPRYCCGSPTYGESAFNLYGRRPDARCTTPYSNGRQPPSERSNTHSFAQTPGHSSRPSTPRPPNYAASTSRYAGDDLEGRGQTASRGSTTQGRNNERRMDQVILSNQANTPAPPCMPPMYPMPPIPPPFPYMQSLGQNSSCAAQNQMGMYPPPPQFGGTYPLPPPFRVPYPVPPFGMPPPGFPLPGTSPAVLPPSTNVRRSR